MADFPDRPLTSEVADPCQMATDEQTRAFLASIIESSDDSTIGTDLEGTILSWNNSGGKEHEATPSVVRMVRFYGPVTLTP